MQVVHTLMQALERENEVHRKKWGLQKVLGSILSWIPDFVLANFIPSPNLTSRPWNAGVQIVTNNLELLTVQAHSLAILE